MPAARLMPIAIACGLTAGAMSNAALNGEPDAWMSFDALAASSKPPKTIAVVTSKFPSVHFMSLGAREVAGEMSRSRKEMRLEEHEQAPAVT